MVARTAQSRSAKSGGGSSRRSAWNTLPLQPTLERERRAGHRGTLSPSGRARMPLSARAIDGHWARRITTYPNGDYLRCPGKG